ncbi:MAG: hypothetical protein QOG04_400 [Actinomycetota bacterium]|jgi:hypothetical protein|nr:hypothetical protein [Actinomycetota bacterium]
MKRVLITLVLAVLFAALAPASNAATPTVTLLPGESVFWGPFNHDDAGAPLEFRIKVPRGADLLRVALDHGDMDDPWTLEVTGPHKGSASGPYSMEVQLTGDPGMYTVVARPNFEGPSEYRLRAQLANVDPPKDKEVLLPNLRVVPPYEFTFKGTFPLESEGVSCDPLETAQERVTRCLRFSFGPENNGRGPLLLRLAPPAEEGGETRMYQRIFRGDGSFKEYDVGTYEYHAAHAHFHHPLLAGQELYRVMNRRTGSMFPAGKAKKTGFCTSDYIMVDWDRFFHAPIHSTEASCGLAPVPTDDAFMGMSTGWADIYYWGLEGNYVNFSDESDGYFVVRAFADSTHSLHESDESDNVSYAYFKIEGSSVKLLERGYGEDPWDPAKEVLNDPRSAAKA